VSVKKKEVENEIEKLMTPEPGGPQDWVWVERNGMRVRPATKTWRDFPWLEEAILTDEEIEALYEEGRDDR
jgi:hypothetical protein